MHHTCIDLTIKVKRGGSFVMISFNEAKIVHYTHATNIRTVRYPYYEPHS